MAIHKHDNQVILDAISAAPLLINQTSPQTINNGRVTFADGIQLGTSPTIGSFSAGKMYYDATNKTVSVNIDGDVNLQLGQEEHILCWNSSGTSIPNGSVVRQTGANGDMPTIVMAQANNDTNSYQVLGVTTQIIPDGSSGLVTCRGIVHDLDTSLFTSGDSLYLSPTISGGITKIAPTDPSQYSVHIADALVIDNSVGSIYVNQSGRDRLVDLDDVAVSSPLAGDNLTWNGLKWINKAAIGASLGTGVTFYLDSSIIKVSGSGPQTVPINALSKSVNPAQTIESAIVNNNTALIKHFVYDTALGTTTINSGIWTFNTYCYVSNASQISTIPVTIRRVVIGTGTITITGSGTSRTATINGSTPLVAGDYNSDITQTALIETPNGIFEIAGTPTGGNTCLITTLTGYSNETSVTFKIHKFLFTDANTDINQLSVGLTTSTSTQPSFSINATDKLSVSYYASTTSTSNRTIYLYYGNATYTNLTCPIPTSHNDSTGLQGGTSNEFYHLTNTQYTNLITGSISQYQITYGSNTNTLAGTNNFIYDSTNKRFGISDTAMPSLSATLHLSKNTNTGLRADTYSNTSAAVAGLQLYKSRGTMASPSAISGGDLMGFVAAYGRGTTGFSPTSRAKIEMVASEDWTDNANGTYISFFTTPSGSTTNTERMRLLSDGGLQVMSISGTNGNIVTHDANGKLLDSGILASSITSTSGTLYNILNDTYFTTGLLRDNLLNPAFDTTTKIFSLSASSGTIDFYIAGQKYQKSSPQTVDLTTIWENNKLFFIYFNSSGVLSAMNTAWDINSNNAPVATVFWNGTAPSSASGPIIGKEYHNATRNLAWHKWAHGTIGTRYKSGLADGFTSSSISIGSGVIEDEDLPILIPAISSARILYRNNGGTAITYQDNISTISAVLSGGLLAYDNAQSTPIPVGTGNYVRNYIYATNDVNVPLACIIGQNYYTNINDARNDPFPSQPTYISAETRLIYTVIWRDVAGVPTFIESTDFRTAPTQPNGSLAIRPIFLDELQDVYAPTPTLDQVLRWNGTQWTNGSAASNSASNGIDFFGASPAIFNILSTPNINQRGMSTYSKTPVISTTLTPVTISITNPGLITYTGHNLPAGTAVVFSTTGALPTGLTAGTTYYVLSNAAYTANAFNVSATIGGTAINTTGTQSGTHTITTGTAAIQTTTTNVANTPSFLRAYLYNSALKRTTIDSGTWTFTLYGGVSSVGNGRVNTIYTNLYRVIEPAGIMSISGSGTTRSVGISGATPFLSTDATSSLLSCSYLQTPTGFFEITGFTSSGLITMTCLTSYVNETNIAPTNWKLWRFLFSAPSPAVTSITPAIQTISYSTVQPSFTFNLEDKFGQIHLCSNTTNNSSTFTVYYDGSTSNSSTKTPLITLHNNLAGVQGLANNEAYHLTASEEAMVSSLNVNAYTATPITPTGYITITIGNDTYKISVEKV